MKFDRLSDCFELLMDLASPFKWPKKYRRIFLFTLPISLPFLMVYWVVLLIAMIIVLLFVTLANLVVDLYHGED